jgi:hypothetical protein
MKKILAGFFMTGAFAFASAQTISFDKTTFDYGNIKAGSDGHRFFTVKNTGDKPLIINEVKASVQLRNGAKIQFYREKLLKSKLVIIQE